jgi:hypothetical protein
VKRLNGGQRRFRGDDGAALIEAAVVTPVFLVIILGLLDEGLLFRSYLTLVNASTVGGRTASIDPKNPVADWKALGAIQNASVALGSSGINKVVVYRASGGTDSITSPSHSSCTNASITDVPGTPGTPGCNLYTTSDLNNATIPSQAANYDCVNKPLTSPSRFWCPANRNATNTNADYAGVYVETTFTYTTKLFGSTRKLTSETIIRLEPQSN